MKFSFKIEIYDIILIKILIKGGLFLVRIRLSRAGRKKHPVYRMIVVDSKKPRETKAIEYIGTYDPILKTGNINVEKALEWIKKVHSLLKER
jgi:ribosomal protein S16